jgi:hypothetical protein
MTTPLISLDQIECHIEYEVHIQGAKMSGVIVRQSPLSQYTYDSHGEEEEGLTSLQLRTLAEKLDELNAHIPF